MIRLKQKKAEEEKKAAEEAANIAAAATTASQTTSETSPTQTSATTNDGMMVDETENNNNTNNNNNESQEDDGLKLFGVGGKAATTANGNALKKNGKKKTPGEIRIQKDIADLDLGNNCQIVFPNPNDLTQFLVTINLDNGYWAGGRYSFSFNIPPLYPHEPPKVICQTPIFHPNIDTQGAVCLNILREEWKPVLELTSVIHGLSFLLTDPNPNDPLNREAAELLRNDAREFQRVVRRTLGGYPFNGIAYPRLV